MSRPSRGESGSAGVHPELLRAGVYVPGTHGSLAAAVREAGLADRDSAGALRSRLAGDPALLDEAVRRLAEEVRGRQAEAVLVARAGDLVVAAPVARECGLPCRHVPSGSEPVPEDWPPPRGERGIGIAVVHLGAEEREIALEEVRRAGATALGWIAVGPGGRPSGEDVWSLVGPEGDEAEGEETNARP